MRAIPLAVLFLAAGALTMTATVSDAGQDKKEAKKPRDGYDELVTVKPWSPPDKRFNNPWENVSAKRNKTKDGKEEFLLSLKDAGESPAVKSEITDKDGSLYIVTKSNGRVGGNYSCVVEKQEPPKKKE